MSESRTAEAAGWDERYAAAGIVWSREPNRFVAAEAGDLPPGRALDVGAGEGRNALWLAGRGWQVTAVDFSAVGLDKGRQAAEALGVAGRVEWVCDDVRSWSPPPRRYDLVVVAYLQLPAEDLAAALARAASGVAPGGRLVAVGHDVTNLERGVGGPRDAARLWSPEQLRLLLTGEGLVVAEARTVERPTPEGTALDTLVTATAPERD